MKLPLRIAPILALFLPIFSFFPAPAGAATAPPGQLSALPTATAVAINSPSTATGHGNTGYGVYGIITSPASATSANSTASPATAPAFESLRLGPSAAPPASCTAPIYGTITARAPDGALCLCHQGYAGKPGFWDRHRAVLLARQDEPPKTPNNSSLPPSKGEKPNQAEKR